MYGHCSYNLGKGYFTNGGHYIVLVGVDAQYIYAHDPASVTRDKAKFDVFEAQAKTYFVFS